MIRSTTNIETIVVNKKDYCFRCGGKLFKRYRLFGDFYRCENIPTRDCRYIRYYKKEEKSVKKRVFISFDYDHDSDIKGSLVGQANLDDSPFEIIDMSIKETIDSNWKVYARKRIKSCDCVIVLCGKSTASAKGVAAELTITQEESIPYFLLWGRNGEMVQKPTSAKKEDKVYKWTWDNIKLLLEGRR